MFSGNPKVSIIMGIYNCENTLRESIESIINQSYENWELIIYDDCSDDKSLYIAKEYEEKYKDKIKVYKNNKNITLGPTLNRCLQKATGTFIARQDGDDISHKDRLKTQVDFLVQNNEIDLVGTSIKIFDKNGFYGERFLNENPKPQDLMRGTTFAHATIVCKKNVYEILDGYSEDENRKGVEDYDLWFRFFEKDFKGVNLNQSLYFVREDRDSYKRKNTKRRINEVITMFNGRRILGLNYKYDLAIFKPICAALIPVTLLEIYHRKKFSK